MKTGKKLAELPDAFFFPCVITILACTVSTVSASPSDSGHCKVSQGGRDGLNPLAELAALRVHSWQADAYNPECSFL